MEDLYKTLGLIKLLTIFIFIIIAQLIDLYTVFYYLTTKQIFALCFIEP